MIDMPMYAYFVNPEGIMRSVWTPKRLDGIAALEEQISYFDEKNMRVARDHAIDRYMRMLCGQNKRILTEASREEREALKERIRRGEKVYP